MNKISRIMLSGPSRPILILFVVLSLLMIKPSPVVHGARFEGNPTVSSDDQGTNPPGWTVYKDPRYKYQVAVPDNWNILPTPLEGDGATATFDNIETTEVVLDDQYKWPEGAYKIDISVSGVMDEGSLIDTARLHLENELNSIVDLSDATDSTYPYVRANLSKKYGPTRTIEVRAVLLSPHDLMVISVFPDDAWENPDIKAIVDSLVINPDQPVSIPTSPPTTSIIPLTADNAAPETQDSQEQTDYACDWGDEVGESKLELYMPFASGRTATVGGSYGFYYGEGWSHIDAYEDYYATDWNIGAHDTDCGKQVFPVAEGRVVVSTEDYEGYGDYIEIAHDSGVSTLYGHLQSRVATQGQEVSIGDLLGYLGKSGAGSGGICHLHLSYRVNGISRYNQDPPSRRPSPMWTNSGNWNLCDGQSRTASKSGILYQEYWRNPQGYRRQVPVVNLTIQWDGAPAPAAGSWFTSLPGSGALQALDMYYLRNTLYQAVWRGDQGFTRSVPIVSGEPNWSGASAWSAPTNLSSSGLPGTGSIQATTNYIIQETLFQSFWRNNYGYSRTVPIIDNIIQWGSATPWSSPVPITGFPGSGNIQALDTYAVGNVKLDQIYWRGDQGWMRTVEVKNGIPQWNTAPAFTGPIPLSSVPGTGSIQASAMEAIP